MRLGRDPEGFRPSALFLVELPTRSAQLLMVVTTTMTDPGDS